MLHTLRWLSVPVLAVSLIAAACGGGDEETSPSEQDATGASATASTTGEPTEVSTESSSSAGESESSDVTADLAEVIGRFGNAVFHATYELEGTSATGEEISGEWTWVQDSPGGRSRIEATMEGETIIMISNADQSVTCAEDSCFSLTGPAAGMMPNLSEMLTGQVDEIEA